MHLRLEGLVGLDPDSDDNLSIKKYEETEGQCNNRKWVKIIKQLHEIPGQKSDFGETREDFNERFLVRNARMCQSRRETR